jgi:hypothetical protein
MGGHEARDYWEHVGLALLLGGLIAGPVGWFLDLQVSYAIVKWTCEHDRQWVLLLVPAGSFAIVAAGSWFSWSCLLKLRSQAIDGGATMVDRSYFLAVTGLGLNALFALLILASLVPRIVLGPCE